MALQHLDLVTSQYDGNKPHSESDLLVQYLEQFHFQYIFSNVNVEEIYPILDRISVRN